MMRRNRQWRAGFTMIELLVVIGIIAVLVGLLVSAVTKVLSAGPRTETMARMKGIDSAIGTFKSDRFGGKGYIPAGQVDITTSSPTFGQVVGKFRLQNSYPATPAAGQAGLNDFEAQYIAQAFGSRVNLADLGGSSVISGTVLLDANQTLLFFLGGIPSWDGQGNAGFNGFSNNPAQPFTPVQQIGETRKGPYLDITPKMVSLDTPSSFPRLIDGYKVPFAYFTAYNGKPNTMTVTTTGAVCNTYTIGGAAQPYKNGGKFLNDSGWQIISAGEDKVFFGTSNDWSNLDGASLDNLANFATKLLGAGPTAK